MGNSQTMCCQGTNPNETQDKIVITLDSKNTNEPLQSEPQLVQYQTPPPKELQFPDYHQNIKQTINSITPEQGGPFGAHLDYSLPVKKFGNQIYQGSVNEEGQPHGFGRMSYQNGNLYIGQFFNGVASGSAFYFDTNGSYYQGKMSSNKANDQNAVYKSKGFQYKGSVVKNQFDGSGKQIGEKHSFQGTYRQGKRSQGTLKWTQKLSKKLPLSTEITEYDGQFTYTGKFNENQNFTGQSILVSPAGTYKGSFVNGSKEGKGIFQYANGVRYDGQYKNNIKEGEGTIYTKDNKVAYSGEMKNGLPNGRGWIPGENGDKNWLEWREGISSLIVENV